MTRAAPKRTPGVSNPVNVLRAEVDRLANEDHATAERYYVERLEQRDRERSAASKIRSALRRMVGL
jgi:hypothetical protein